MTDVTDQKKEDRARKVDALFKKAERASTSEEAEAFFEKAQQLMSRWSIDDSMLRAAGQGIEDQLEQRKFVLQTTYFKADVELLVGIGYVNDCKGVMGRPRGRGIPGYMKLVGYRSDLDNVERLFNLLLIQAVRGSVSAVQSDYDTSTPYIFRKSFRIAFANRIEQRLKEQKKRAVHDAARTYQSSGMELVLADKKTQVAVFYEDQFANAKKSKASRIGWSGTGADQGRAAGDRADIGNSRVRGSGKGLTR